MLYKNVTEKLDPKNPWGHCQLGRRRYGELLTQVISTVSQPYVISLEASYGTGKTFFINCWKHDLESKGYKTAYFNAWQTDFSSDPLTAFIAAIKSQCENNKSTAQKVKDLTRNSGIFFRRKFIPLLVKRGADFVFGEAGTEEINQILADAAEEAVEAQLNAVNQISSFRESLKSIIADINAQRDTYNITSPTKQNLIIFVDDLDRCKPTYTVELLETIKHFFSVEGLIFVLSVDEQEVANAIASVYGPKFNSEGYLRKFIDWRFKLPDASTSQFAGHLSNAFNFTELKTLTSKKDDWINSRKMLCDGFSLGVSKHNVSLRVQKQIFSHMNLVLRSLHDTETPYSFILGFLSVVFANDITKIEKIVGDTELKKQYLQELTAIIAMHYIDLEDKLRTIAMIYTAFFNAQILQSKTLHKILNDNLNLQNLYKENEHIETRLLELISHMEEIYNGHAVNVSLCEITLSRLKLIHNLSN